MVIYLSRFYIYFVFIYLYLFVYYFGEVGGGKQYNCFPLKIPTRTGPGPKVMELKKKSKEKKEHQLTVKSQCSDWIMDICEITMSKCEA